MTLLQRLGFGKKAMQIETGEKLPNVTVNYNRRIFTANENDIYDIYKESPLIQSCVNTWLNEFTSAPCKPYVNDNPVETAGIDIFNVHIMQQMMFQMLISGTAFVYKIRNAQGVLVNVQVLSGFHVWKYFDSNGYLDHWIYKTNRGEFQIPKEDIIPFTWFTKSTDDEDFGISPISTIILQAQQINELQRFVTDLASNDFVPRTILSAPPNLNLTMAQQKQIIDQVREEFQNNPGSIKVLNGGWSISRLALGLDEMNTESLRIVPEADICGAFQIPPTVLHTVAGMQNSTYNNVESSRKFFIQNTVGGMWSRVEQLINEHFSFEFQSQPQWFFETADLPSMQEDTNDKFLRLQSMYQGNAISRAEFRAEMDLEDIDGGQEVFYQDIISQASFGFSLAQEPEPTPEPILPTPTKSRKKKVKAFKIPADNPETKAQFWRRYNRITSRNSREFRQIVDKMIDDMKERTITAVRFNSRFIANGNLKPEDFREYNDRLLSAQNEFRTRLANDLGFAFDDVGQLARNELQGLVNRSSDEMFLSMEKMIADTEQQLSLIATDAIDDKIEIIEKQFQKFKNVHAPAIADYSANNIGTGTQQILMDDKGIKYKWLTQRDSRVRDSHQIDGQEPDESGYFTLTDGERTKRPCAPGMTAKNSMRCRCLLYPSE